MKFNKKLYDNVSEIRDIVSTTLKKKCIILYCEFNLEFNKLVHMIFLNKPEIH